MKVVHLYYVYYILYITYTLYYPIWAMGFTILLLQVLILQTDLNAQKKHYSCAGETFTGIFRFLHLW